MSYYYTVTDNKSNTPDHLKDIQDLIDIAEGTQKGSSPNEVFDPNLSEIRRFIQDCNIAVSKSQIPMDVVYDFYTQWSNNAATLFIFKRYFSKFFNPTRIMGVLCFKITPQSMNLPDFYTIYKDPRFNKTLKGRKKSNLLGVSITPAGYYHARLKTDSETIFIGRFNLEKEAAEAYDLEVIKYYGEEAKINYPQKIKEYKDRIQSGHATVQQKRKVPSTES